MLTQHSNQFEIWAVRCYNSGTIESQKHVYGLQSHGTVWCQGMRINSKTRAETEILSSGRGGRTSKRVWESSQCHGLIVLRTAKRYIKRL